MDVAIRTENISRNFGKRTAVDKINLEIRKGEIFSLLGTNGAGKTTTIKILCCLLSASSGNASILNYDIRKEPLQIKKLIGVSPQETAVAMHLNTKENLVLMGGVYGLSKNRCIARAEELMKLMELEDRKDQARKLSGGQQRRLSIAMALMSDPQIIFLDEPTLGLDPHSRKSVWNYIEKLKKTKTILLTTHYLEEADSLADHIAIMDAGKIIAKGSPDELKKSQNQSQILKISGDNITENLVVDLKNNGLKINKREPFLEIVNHNIDIYKVMDILKAKDVIINSIEMKEPTLDEVFLNLTKKEDLQ